MYNPNHCASFGLAWISPFSCFVFFLIGHFWGHCLHIIRLGGISRNATFVMILFHVILIIDTWHYITFSPPLEQPWKRIFCYVCCYFHCVCLNCLFKTGTVYIWWRNCNKFVVHEVWLLLNQPQSNQFDAYSFKPYRPVLLSFIRIAVGPVWCLSALLSLFWSAVLVSATLFQLKFHSNSLYTTSSSGIN